MLLWILQAIRLSLRENRWRLRDRRRRMPGKYFVPREECIKKKKTSHTLFIWSSGLLYFVLTTQYHYNIIQYAYIIVIYWHQSNIICGVRVLS